jgi:translation initiation factor IF-3
MNFTPTREGPRINEEIGVPRVRLVDDQGNMVGVVGRNEALTMAVNAGLDLVEIAPNADPPVCKILDFGKYKYEEQKKKNEARKKQKIIEVKEIKLRPSIDDHDYDVKMRSMVKFLEEGDKVKVTMRFRGRELAHQELGMDVLVGPRQSAGARQGRADAAHGRPPDDNGHVTEIGPAAPGRVGEAAACFQRSAPV